MSEHDLKIKIGIFLILSHFTVLIVVMIVSAIGWMEFTETTTSVALITPVFATYTTAIIRFIIDHRRAQNVKSPVVTKTYVFISFFIPALFVSALIIIVILRGYKVWIRDPDMYKQLLGAAETIFGVYVGMILRDMFEMKKRPQKA
jgi:hypothetical protein